MVEVKTNSNIGPNVNPNNGPNVNPTLTTPIMCQNNIQGTCYKVKGGRLLSPLHVWHNCTDCRLMFIAENL